MLQVKNLNSYYGKSHILQGVNLLINEGEIISLLGRNGVGRSTFIKSVMGMVDSRGSISFYGKEILGRSIHEIANIGIGYVSENRDIFPDLTVEENLELGKKENRNGVKWNTEELFDLFPNLKKRINVLGGVLSGGEQQMLTICRCLMGCPKLIMIDEPKRIYWGGEIAAPAFREIAKQTLRYLNVPSTKERVVYIERA